VVVTKFDDDAATCLPDIGRVLMSQAVEAPKLADGLADAEYVKLGSGSKPYDRTPRKTRKPPDDRFKKTWLTRALAVEFRRNSTDVRALADRIRIAVYVPIGRRCGRGGIHRLIIAQVGLERIREM
jgi:hypothetical protein